MYSDEVTHFKLKKILFKEKARVICLQNNNGPCPLLSIGNVLLLTGKIALKTDSDSVSMTRLMDLVLDVIFQNISLDSSDNGTKFQDYEQQLPDIINTFSGLGVGLNIDIKFDNANSFEPTKERAIFDFCGINLYHGWIPEEEDYRRLFICSKSYNQIVQSIAEEKSKRDVNGQNLCQNHCESEVIQDIFSWLQDTSSQLTYSGLVSIHQCMEEDELGIFFRNNHFSVIYKYNGVLYLLVTDQGYLDQANIVWEKLSSVSGDCVFVDSEFNDVVCESDYVGVDKETLSSMKVNEELARQIQIKEDSIYSKSIADNEMKNRSLASNGKDDQKHQSTSITANSSQKKSHDFNSSNATNFPPKGRSCSIL